MKKVCPEDWYLCLPEKQLSFLFSLSSRVISFLLIVILTWNWSRIKLFDIWVIFQQVDAPWFVLNQAATFVTIYKLNLSQPADRVILNKSDRVENLETESISSMGFILLGDIYIYKSIDFPNCCQLMILIVNCQEDYWQFTYSHIHYFFSQVFRQKRWLLSFRFTHPPLPPPPPKKKKTSLFIWLHD